jgi:hypothetical protein
MWSRCPLVESCASKILSRPSCRFVPDGPPLPHWLGSPSHVWAAHHAEQVRCPVQEVQHRPMAVVQGPRNCQVRFPTSDCGAAQWCTALFGRIRHSGAGLSRPATRPSLHTHSRTATPRVLAMAAPPRCLKLPRSTAKPRRRLPRGFAARRVFGTDAQQGASAQIRVGSKRTASSRAHRDPRRQPCRSPVRPRGNPYQGPPSKGARCRGELDTTYLDGTLRVSRGDKGNLFVLTRDP